MWATYSNPEGLYTLDYPAGWRLEASGRGVLIYSYTPEEGDKGWGPGIVKIEVAISDTAHTKRLEGGSPTTVSGRPATYRIRRAGDPSIHPDQTLVARVQFARDSDTYGLSLASGNSPADADEDLFWELLRRWRLT